MATSKAGKGINPGPAEPAMRINGKPTGGGRMHPNGTVAPDKSGLNSTAARKGAG